LLKSSAARAVNELHTTFTDGSVVKERQLAR